MGELLQLVEKIHNATKRDYLGRMQDDKVHCMKVAREYGKDFWDGDRRYGYGGYKYIPGYWEPVAKVLIERYNLTNESHVLDVGCGKGILLFELTQLLPGITVRGTDISTYGIENAKPEVAPFLIHHVMPDTLPFKDNEFDLVISLACLHNLQIFDVVTSVKEISRVGKAGYVMLEAYRNEEELFNLECWALTAESYLHVDEWTWLYQQAGYTGDYEFIYFI